MSTPRPSLKTRFGTPEKNPRLRIICATIGPGKANLLALLAETHSISAAARRMKMTYKQAWDLLDAMNTCFRAPLAVTATGGKQGGGTRLSPLGAREMRQLSHLLKLSED